MKKVTYENNKKVNNHKMTKSVVVCGCFDNFNESQN